MALRNDKETDKQHRILIWLLVRIERLKHQTWGLIWLRVIIERQTNRTIISFFAFSTDKETCKQHRDPYLANGKERETDKPDTDPYLTSGKDRETDKQNYFLLCFE